MGPRPYREFTLEEERNAIAEANIMSVADPLALGLTSFGIITFLGGIVAAGYFLPDSIGYLVPVGFLFGGVAQFLAGMWAFSKHDVFSATLFTSYSAFWMALSALVAGVGIGLLPGGVTLPFLGMFFGFWAAEMIYLFVASMRYGVIMSVITGLLLLSFVLLSIGSFIGSFGLIAVGGWVAIVCGIVAWYGAGARLINEILGERRIPV
jgi:hypothetical protein